MSHASKKATAEREALGGDIELHVRNLEGVVERFRHQSPMQAVTVSQTLVPLAEMAHAIRAEYAAYQARFGAVLNRVAVLDLDALEHFHGFFHVSPLPAAARRITRDIAAALAELDDVLEQAAAVAQGQRSNARIWDIRETVKRREVSLWNLPSDIRFVVARIGNFESAQPLPQPSGPPQG